MLLLEFVYKSHQFEELVSTKALYLDFALPFTYFPNNWYFKTISRYFSSQWHCRLISNQCSQFNPLFRLIYHPEQISLPPQGLLSTAWTRSALSLCSESFSSSEAARTSSPIQYLFVWLSDQLTQNDCLRPWQHWKVSWGIVWLTTWFCRWAFDLWVCARAEIREHSDRLSKMG